LGKTSWLLLQTSLVFSVGLIRQQNPAKLFNVSKVFFNLGNEKYVLCGYPGKYLNPLFQKFEALLQLTRPPSQQKLTFPLKQGWLVRQGWLLMLLLLPWQVRVHLIRQSLHGY
jgi:hypothetical protein